ncbi:prophage tail fiber N-terminal domain-containing protein, partial [Escherichia coli]|nr:prophage tail fiber N-terminal domain-containing protein [Escherichia coli]
MAVKISGVLKDATGSPIPDCIIRLRAKRTGKSVLAGTVASEEPESNGSYSMSVEPGSYSVILVVDGCPPSHVGDIVVFEDSEPGTLNDFLCAMTEDDVRPEALRRFEEMVAQAQQSAEVAAVSEQQTAQHVADTQKIKDECQTLASDVKRNADGVAEIKEEAEELVSRAEELSAQIEKSAESAEKSASDAEQARDDISASLATMLKSENNLSEIAAGGEEAQQASRDNLGVKAAATMDVQSDIRDRTEGRLALPGAYGYGRLFVRDEH